MTRYLGGLITKDESLVLPANNYEDTSAPGVWTLEEAQMLAKQSLWPTAGNVNPTKFIENIFSCDTYTGTASSNTITTGIDLANNSGLVWGKRRDVANSHFLINTVQGATKRTESDGTGGGLDKSSSFTSFNNNGFTVATGDAEFNASGGEYVTWTFRKAPKFFDVVQYSGTGSEQSIAHNLGQVPGMIIHKRTDTNEDWRVYHRMANGGSSPEDYIIQLNGDDDFSNDNTNFGAPTSTHFVVKTSSGTNNGSGTYIAYLFGHDTSSDGMIQCGSYTGNASNPGPSVTLGFEPQWLLVKQASGGSNDWFIWDTIRGLPANVANSSASLNPNKSDTEAVEYGTAPTATGFQLQDNNAAINTNSATYIYVAIRKAPMATPTARSDVFHVEAKSSGGTQTFTTGFPVDFIMNPVRLTSGTASGNFSTLSRLQGGNTASTYRFMRTRDDAIEQTGTGAGWELDHPNKYVSKDIWSSSNMGYAWRRAPGFFDVVAYTGTGSARTLNHNLGVAPEMFWCKSRETVSSSNSWLVYHKNLPTPNDDTFTVNGVGDIGTGNGTLLWNSTAPTSTVFSLGTYNGLNQSGKDYIAYLWATLAGISKVGSFSHTNGSSTDVDCGFSSGSSLVWVRRIDSGISNDALFYVWDSARGIVSGNDPYLTMNSNAIEVTGTDLIDPLDSGFQMASGFTTGDYIFYAIAA
tara:strand:- start:1031 stop:3106 length:2076 start_codon:yes stop_codon:yes gene_type:complete